MFKVVTGQDRTFLAKVKFKLPNDAGKSDVASFNVLYVMLTTEETKGSMELTGAEFCRKVVRRIDDLVDVDGKALAYNEEVLEAVLEVPAAIHAIVTTYHDTINAGLPRAKN